MDKARAKTAPKINTTSRYVTVTSNETNTNNYRTLQYDRQPSRNSLRITVPNRESQPDEQFQGHNNQNPNQSAKQAQPISTSNSQQENQPSAARRRNRKRKDKNTVSQGEEQETTQNLGHITQLSDKHLEALKTTFDKIVKEQFLSKVDREQHLSIYNQLRDIILRKRPDAQVTLYGSLSFECFLKGTSIIDIDVQFNEIVPYDTLRELLSIVRTWDSCKNAHFNIDTEPVSIDVTLVNSNILVRFTSNNIQAIRLSEIVQIYIKFDRRVLYLLRLFRFFSLVCKTDQRELGTLHPIVFHLMIIHFLQQLDSPILPCLHEYVFGIEKTPVALSNDQYVEFFQVCNEYAGRWKSKNTTSTEMLFLQLLSYYARKFNSKRFVISIQTRMPLLRLNKKQLFSRNLFCPDPMFINRNLCYTMRAGCLVTYFENTLAAALNYFCQPLDYENNDGNSLKKHLVEIIHKSYALFIGRFSKKNEYWKNVQQEELREDYKKTFDKEDNPIPEPILKLNENNTFQLLNDDDDNDHDDDDGDREKTEEISRQDAEIIANIDQNEDENEQIVTTTQNEPQAIVAEENVVHEQSDNENKGEELVLFETLAKNLDEKQKEILRKEYDQQVRLFNKAMQQALDGIKSSEMLHTNPLPTNETSLNKPCSNSTKESIVSIPSIEPDLSFYEDKQIDHPEIFYDMQAKNFGAAKGPPTVCTVCYQRNHTKSRCPELFVPIINNIPKPNKQWSNVITRICRQVADQCKSTKQDIKIREEIVEYLQNEFVKCYPSSSVHIYGSSQNGFGFRQSDLDICIVLKDNNEESNIIVLEKLLKTLQLNPDIFQDVELVRDARVPIIRSIHSKFHIEIDISLNNILAMENTRLLRTYAQIDPRVSELGYMIKHLVKVCDIGDAKTGTLSSYAYILMLIHFLQQIYPSVLPVLQQLSDGPLKKNLIRECNVYFYDDLSKLKQVWVNGGGSNNLTSGELWVEFLRYYTEVFNYENHIVSIRQIQLLPRDDKGWFNRTIAIEDPFILTHNLADRLSIKKWALIRRVFIETRQQFCFQPQDLDIQRVELGWIQEYLFDVSILCPEAAYKFYRAMKKADDNNKKLASNVNGKENIEQSKPLMNYQNRETPK